MKKLFSLFIAIALLAAVASPCLAAFPSDTKYTITNTSAVSQITTIPSSLIGADGKFALLRVTVGRTIGHTGTSAEAVVGVFDATNPLTATNGNLECEIESNDFDTESMDWIRPLKIYQGVTVVQGAYSVVSIEYMRLRP